MRYKTLRSAQPIYDFPVELQDVQTVGGVLIEGSQAVVRTDKNEPLAIVSDRYRLITHKELVEAADPFIKKLGKAEKIFTLEKNGARLVTEYTFRDNVIKLPGHRIPGETRKVGDTVALRLYGINSYNTSTPFEIRLAAMVLRCLNGAMIGEDMFNVKFKHVVSPQEK